MQAGSHWAQQSIEFSSLKFMSVGLAGLLDEESQQEVSDTKLGEKIKLTEYLIFPKSHLDSVYYCCIQNVDIVQFCD